MKVRDLMKSDVKSCRPSDSLNIAARIMWENDCGCVPVVDSENRVLGVLTDRDVCMAAYTQGLSLHLIQAESAMGSPAVCCNSTDKLETAEQLMRDAKVRRLPVCDREGKLVGILSLSDIACATGRKGIRENQEAELARVLGAVSEPRAHSMAHVTYAPEEGELEF